MWTIMCLLFAEWALYVGVIGSQLEIIGFYNPFTLVSRLTLS